MALRRRRQSISDDTITERPAKRSKRIASNAEPANEDEDLDEILAQIREQEASEALARQLQEEWGNEGTAGTAGASASSTSGVLYKPDDDDDDDDAIVIGDDEGSEGEALAIQLSLEDFRKAQGGVVKRATRSSTRNSDNNIVTTNIEPAQPRSSGRIRASSESTTGLDKPPDSRLKKFTELFTANRPCSKCGTSLPSPRGIVAFSANLPPPSLLSLMHVSCSKCKINHCRGCFTPLSCSPPCRGKAKSANCTVDSCCAEVRAIALFEALGGFDRLYIGERANSEARAKDAATKASANASASVGPGGTGYGTGGTHHQQYGPGQYPNARGKKSVNLRFTDTRGQQAQNMAAHWDDVVVRALTTIKDFLPDPYSDSGNMYDILPHACIQHLLPLSQLPELLGSLLRNDSVSDWILRSEVYYAMLALLRRMADCELTVEILIEQQWDKDKSCGLEGWMWNDGEVVWERPKPNAPISRSQPLYAHFKKLTKQCEAFLAGASQLMQVQGGDEEVDDTTIRASSLCGDIIAARDDIERAMKAMGKDISVDAEENQVDQASGTVDSKGRGKGQGKGKGKNRDLAVDMERVYTRECEHLAFKHVALSEPSSNGTGLAYPTFSYTNELTMTASATRNPKCRLHLVKELAVTATSLPPGVWVRVDEVRNDVIKIMIAGPTGTPYEGGLFEFDCFIPLEYPNVPPLMHLRTTGGGSVRFNPNLYNSGKVCLSLLGTWLGRPEEQWSNKSTLLQVLVSIQSMILIDLPYFNEPGYGTANASNHSSIAYNKNIYLQTVRWAVVDWMKDEHKNGVWADVIASHFTIRKDSIRKTIEKWAKTQPLIRAYTDRKNAYQSDVTGGWAPGIDAVDYGYAMGAAPTHKATATSNSTRNLLEEFNCGIKLLEDWSRDKGSGPA